MWEIVLDFMEFSSYSPSLLVLLSLNDSARERKHSHTTGPMRMRWAL